MLEAPLDDQRARARVGPLAERGPRELERAAPERAAPEERDARVPAGVDVDVKMNPKMSDVERDFRSRRPEIVEER